MRPNEALVLDPDFDFPWVYTEGLCKRAQSAPLGPTPLPEFKSGYRSLRYPRGIGQIPLGHELRFSEGLESRHR